jgi:hypothetical protein
MRRISAAGVSSRRSFCLYLGGATPFDALCDPSKRERDTDKKYRVDESR